MKKRVLIALGIMMVLALSACKKNEVEPTSTGTDPEVTTTAATKESETGGGPGATTAEGEEGSSAGIKDPSFTLYVGNSDATGLLETRIPAEEVTAELIIEELKKAKILESDTKLLSFEMKDDTGILNLSTVPSGGSAEETILLISIGNTFTKAFNLEKVKLLIDGKNYSSGHIEDGDDDYLKFNKNYRKLGS